MLCQKQNSHLVANGEKRAFLLDIKIYFRCPGVPTMKAVNHVCEGDGTSLREVCKSIFRQSGMVYLKDRDMLV